MKKNIILVGFMGSGKTVTSTVLADRLGMTRVSTDEMIIAREGRSINQIFEQDGEKYFRDVESAVVSELSDKRNLVIDCGGGVVLRDENMLALKKSGVVIFLKTSPDVIFARVKDHTHRPLLNVDDPVKVINDLLEQRAIFYAKADIAVLTDGKTAQQVAGEIIDILKTTP